MQHCFTKLDSIIDDNRWRDLLVENNKMIKKIKINKINFRDEDDNSLKLTGYNVNIGLYCLSKLLIVFNFLR